MNQTRPGFVLVTVLVCLTVLALISIESFKTVVMERREFRNQENRLQADWLAEAGVERAAARLAADAEYRGETWRLSAAEIGGAAGGEVLIQLEPLADEPGRLTAQIQADYPAEGDLRARRGKRVVIERPQTGEKP